MIPQKIKPYFKEIFQKEENNNQLIEGVLECCGSHEYEIEYKGDVKRRLFYGRCLFPKDGEIALVARCKKCSKEFSVFDSNYDGYEPCKTKPVKNVLTTPYICEKCACNDFSIEIKYEYPDIQELMDIGIIETDNAFTWIWITIVCNRCGKTLSNFIDFET